MKNFKLYLWFMALGVLMLGGFAHGASNTLYLHDITPSVTTPHYYFIGSTVQLSGWANDGSGNYNYFWNVTAGTCPPYTLNTVVATSNTFNYVSSAATNNCVFHLEVMDASNHSNGNGGENTNVTNIVSPITAAITPSSATTVNISNSISNSVTVGISSIAGAVGNYSYAWTVNSATSCPGYTSTITTNSFTYAPTASTTNCVFNVQVSSAAPYNNILVQNFSTAAITATNSVNGGGGGGGGGGNNLTVTIANNAILGNYLANATGYALYMFTPDKPYSGNSACYNTPTDQCATIWPPFYVSNLILPSTLSASNFNVITRTDGTKQLTYLGYPLYYYEFDTGPGTTRGQGQGKVWYLMTPTGPDIPSNTTVILTASNSIVDSGQTETLNASVNGGSGIFTYTFYNITGSKPISSCDAITSNTCTFVAATTSGPLALSYNVVVDDTIYSSVSNSIANSITIYNAPLLYFTATSTNSPILNITSNTPAVNSINTTNNVTSLTLPAGKQLYICEAGSNNDWLDSTSWTADANDVGVNAFTLAGALGAYTSIGRQSSNICTASTTPASDGLIIGGVGLSNSNNYTLTTFTNMTTNTPSGVSTQVLHYTVANPNSTAIILMTAGYVQFGTIPAISGCTVLENVTGPNNAESIFIAECKDQSVGSYAVTANIASVSPGTGAISQVAYVFTPKNNSVAANQPLITTQTVTSNTPTNTVITGNSVSLPYGSNITITATVKGGIGPFSYDWILNGTALASNLASLSQLISAPNYLFSVTALDQGTSTTYTTTSNTFNVTATGNSTTSTTTSVTTTVSSGGGGGSTGGGGGGGGGGSAKPIITNITNGYTVNNIAQTDTFSIVFCGVILQSTDNFITPNSTGVTIGKSQYTLNVSQPEQLIAGKNCYVELTNVSYLPILDTVTLQFYNTSISNATNQTVAKTITFSLNSTNVTNLAPSNTVIKVANVTASTPAAPTNYTKLEALNISLVNSTNTTTLSLNVKVACGTSNVVPFILTNNTWQQIKPSTYNPSTCTVSFAIPADPVVALMSPTAQNPKQVQPTTTLPTTVVTTSIAANSIVSVAKPSAAPIKLIGIVVVLAVILIVVIVIIASAGNKRKRSNGRRSTDNY